MQNQNLLDKLELKMTEEEKQRVLEYMGVNKDNNDVDLLQFLSDLNASESLSSRSEILEQSGKTNSKDYNQQFKDIYYDLVRLFKQAEKVGNKIEDERQLNESKIKEINKGIKKIKNKVDGYKYFVTDNTFSDVKRDTFDTKEKFEDFNDKTKYLYREILGKEKGNKYGRNISKDLICDVNKTSSNITLSRLGTVKSDDKNVSINLQTGHGLIREGNKKFEVDNAIDGDIDDVWSEIILTDSPIEVQIDSPINTPDNDQETNIGFFGRQTGALCKLRVGFETAVPINTLTINPFGDLPFELVSVLAYDDTTKLPDKDKGKGIEEASKVVAPTETILENDSLGEITGNSIDEKTIKTSGYNSLNIRCNLFSKSMDNSDEKTQLLWYTGTEWKIISSYQETNQNNYSSKSVNFDIPREWLSDDNKIRLDLIGEGSMHTEGNGPYDYGKVENLTITGRRPKHLKPKRIDKPTTIEFKEIETSVLEICIRQDQYKMASYNISKDKEDKVEMMKRLFEDNQTITSTTESKKINSVTDLNNENQNKLWTLMKKFSNKILDSVDYSESPRFIDSLINGVTKVIPGISRERFTKLLKDKKPKSKKNKSVNINKYEYQYGAKEIDAYYTEYTNKSVYVSKLFNFDGNTKSVGLHTQDYTPKVKMEDGTVVPGTSIEYYVTNLENPDDNDWYSILPENYQGVVRGERLFSNSNSPSSGNFYSDFRFIADEDSDIEIYKNGQKLTQGEDYELQNATSGPGYSGVKIKENWSISSDDIYIANYNTQSDKSYIVNFEEASEPREFVSKDGSKGESFDGTDKDNNISLTYYPYVDYDKINEIHNGTLIEKSVNGVSVDGTKIDLVSKDPDYGDYTPIKKDSVTVVKNDGSGDNAEIDTVLVEDAVIYLKNSYSGDVEVNYKYYQNYLTPPYDDDSVDYYYPNHPNAYEYSPNYGFNPTISSSQGSYLNSNNNYSRFNKDIAFGYRPIIVSLKDAHIEYYSDNRDKPFFEGEIPHDTVGVPYQYSYLQENNGNTVKVEQVRDDLDKPFIWNNTDYINKKYPALTAYNPEDYPVIEYLQLGNLISFNTQLEPGLSNNYAESINVEYQYLVEGVRLKIVMRRNVKKKKYLTPCVYDYTLKSRTFEF